MGKASAMKKQKIAHILPSEMFDVCECGTKHNSIGRWNLNRGKNVHEHWPACKITASWGFDQGFNLVAVTFYGKRT